MHAVDLIAAKSPLAGSPILAITIKYRTATESACASIVLVAIEANNAHITSGQSQTVYRFRG